MKLGLQSADVSVQVDCLRGFRRLLSLEKNSPVKQCIACGAVPLFVQFLQRLENTELQFEAAWVLTNIASSDETEIVVKCNAIPHLVNLLLSTNSDIREQVHYEDLSVICSHCTSYFDAPFSPINRFYFSEIISPLISFTLLFQY